jgi:hypothetical protein
VTAHDLIHAVMRDRWRRNFVLPNYTPAGWWENDVFEVTDAGYWREYEVKVSLADFRRDSEKLRNKVVSEKIPDDERTGRKTHRLVSQTLNKHQLLADRSPKGPSAFWFVVPSGLIQAAEVPEWAGLMWVNDRGTKHRRRWRFTCHEVKKAPKLHKEKCGEKVVKHARGVCYWRLHEALATQEPDAEPDYSI